MRNVIGIALGTGVVVGAVAIAIKNTITAEDIKRKYDELLKEFKQYADINIPRKLNDEKMAKAADEFTQTVAKTAATFQKQAHHVVDTVMTDNVKENLNTIKEIGVEAKRTFSAELDKFKSDIDKAKQNNNKTDKID